MRSLAWETKELRYLTRLSKMFVPGVHKEGTLLEMPDRSQEERLINRTLYRVHRDGSLRRVKEEGK